MSTPQALLKAKLRAVAVCGGDPRATLRPYLLAELAVADTVPRVPIAATSVNDLFRFLPGHSAKRLALGLAPF